MDNLGIRIVNVARCRYKHHPSVSRHRHPFHHLLFVTGGRAGLLAGPREYALGRGNLVLVPPDLEHEFASDTALPLQTIEVKFCLSDEWLHEAVARIPLHTAEAGDPIGSRLEQIVREAIGGLPYHADLMKAILYACLICLVREASGTPGPRPSGAHEAELPESLCHGSGTGPTGGSAETLARVAGYIRANLHRRISLSDLSTVFAVSEEHLCRMFSRFCGVSPMQLCNRLRIERAKDLLAHTQLRVSEIADKVGFPSVHHMSRYFSSKVGQSPVHYRAARQDSIYVDVEEPRQVGARHGQQSPTTDGSDLVYRRDVWPNAVRQGR